MNIIDRDLFEQEQQFLDYAMRRITEAPENEIFCKEEYEDAVKEYRSLLKQVRRITKITDKITEELNESQLEADIANKAKSDFLANMSHEIRTPINAVLGMSELILRETAEQAIIEYASNIQNAGKTLLSLVNDILDLSKIESGKMEIIQDEYEIASLLNDLVNMISFMAEEKGLALILDIASDLPHRLYGDEIRLKQIMVNLLTNAVKYTHEGSVSLCIRWERLGADTLNLIFSVKDTGIGIREQDMVKLFTSFERIEEKRNRSIEGTGLGMSIVFQLLRLMDSMLEVESVYGKGSVFGFRVSQKIISEDAVGNFKEMYERSVKTKKARQAQFVAPNAKILLVDDNEMNLKVAKGLLKHTRIQVVTATSGMKCLELIQETHFDVIMLDHMMPVMDGVQTLSFMKEQELNLCKCTPVIVLTANAVIGAREKYLKEGFDDYLSKPIESAELEKIVLKHLPPELIEIADDSYEYNETAENALPEIEGVDIAEAVRRSGGVEMVFRMFHDFYGIMPAKIETIERYLSEERVKDYTIEVHSLKSSARIIGAVGLSELAEYLESCGNAGDIAEMREKTPELIAAYLSIGENIKPYADAEELSEGDKTEISKEELKKIFVSMREHMEVFDIDPLDEQVKMLGGRKLPPDVAALFEKMKSCVADVDMDGGIELIEQALGCIKSKG